MKAFLFFLMTLFFVAGGASADHSIFDVDGVPASIQGAPTTVEAISRQFAGYRIWDDEIVPHHLAAVQCRVSLQAGCERTLVTCWTKAGASSIGVVADGDITAVVRRLASKAGR